jgi:ribosomal protein S18 acetylase RimI-like enzyme
VSRSARIEIIDVTDAAAFALFPPCADPRFDHRSCDYWEDGVHGSKAARPAWWQDPAPAPRPTSPPVQVNPFAPPARARDDFNPFLPSADAWGDVAFNPFAPESEAETEERHVPRKLRLLDRGRTVFGSYAKVLLRGGEPAVFAQFGPLSAYERAQRIRELYPRLPSSPLPAVITCIATTPAARGAGLGRRLVEAVVEDLARRGFAAVEAYPDLTLPADEASAATPTFWRGCGFDMAVDDERYPVMRRSLG